MMILFYDANRSWYWYFVCDDTPIRTISLQYFLQKNLQILLK